MANIKKLGPKVDKLYQMKEEIEKDEALLKKKKGKFEEAKQKLMGELNEQGLGKIEGTKASFTLANKSRVAVDDWDKLYTYITKNKAFDLLTRSVNSKAAKDRLENKEKLSFLHIEPYRSPMLIKLKR